MAIFQVVGQFPVIRLSGVTRLTARYYRKVYSSSPLRAWAVDPIKSGRERNQSDGVVIFAVIEREAIVEPGGLEFVEELCECGRVFRDVAFVAH
jgi:hypothetical protein